MHSAFDNEISRALGPFYEVLGEMVTYSPRDGAAVVCTAIVDRDLSRHGDEVQIVDGAVEVILRIADVPLRPQRGDRLVIDDAEFVVQDIRSSDRLEHRVIAA
jgi:hypothetical protein